MMMTHDWNLPALIDHTVLRPDATKADVLRLCQEARAVRFRRDLCAALLHR